MAQSARSIEVILTQCLTRWSFVENDLAATFSYAVSGTLSPPALAAFFSVRSSDARIKLTDAAVSCLPLSEQLSAEWKALKNSFAGKLKKRNELAHCEVVLYPSREWRNSSRGYPMTNGDFESVVRPFAATHMSLVVSHREHLADPQKVARDFAQWQAGGGQMPRRYVAGSQEENDTLYIEDISDRATSFTKYWRRIAKFNDDLKTHLISL